MSGIVNANADTTHQCMQRIVTSYLMEENALGINDVNVVCVLFPTTQSIMVAKLFIDLGKGTLCCQPNQVGRSEV